MSFNRQRLKAIAYEVYERLEENLYDPKNTAKGDGWREYSWSKLRALSHDEHEEFRREIEADDKLNADPVRELADALICDVMQVDKHRSEIVHAAVEEYNDRVKARTTPASASSAKVDIGT